MQTNMLQSVINFIHKKLRVQERKWKWETYLYRDEWRRNLNGTCWAVDSWWWVQGLPPLLDVARENSVNRGQCPLAMPKHCKLIYNQSVSQRFMEVINALRILKRYIFNLLNLGCGGGGDDIHSTNKIAHTYSVTKLVSLDFEFRLRGA